MPVTPLKLDGIRMLPPPSLPVARVQSPEISAAAAPPLLPPGVQSMFQGLRQGSLTRFSVVPDCPNSGVLVLPRIMPPAALTRSTTMESMSGTRSRKMAEPRVVVTPFRHLQVLDGYGDAVERPQGIATLHRRVGLAGGGGGFVVADRQVGAELRIKLVDPV